jgi:hypothetical protein
VIALLCGLAFAGKWELAGLYDTSGFGFPTEEGADPAPTWVWSSPPGMGESCGPAKAPDGLGVMEAQVLANATAPALAILLRRTSVDTPLPDPNDLLVSVGDDKNRVTLAPFVEPRYLAIEIAGSAPASDKQLVRTQLEMELCMEHKTGRAWRGGTATQLREALLLRAPEAVAPHRLHYRGQRDPVPAFLGPPDACLDMKGEDSQSLSAGASSSLRLVPSDVWGASLRPCPTEAGELRPPGRVPLWSSDGVEVSGPAPRWSRLRIDLQAAEGGSRIQAHLDDAPLIVDEPLEVPLGGAGAQTGLFDIAAHLPIRYPTWGDAEDPDRYIALLVPNWQLVEAANRLSGTAFSTTAGVTDGVGWLLHAPERLFVQIGGRSGNLPNLASRADAPGPLRWGYPVGSHAGRSPILLPGGRRPAADEQAQAQGAPRQALFLGSLFVLLGVGLAALLRVRDLWVSTPVERVNYWPGAAEPNKAEGPALAEPLGAVGEGGE